MSKSPKYTTADLEARRAAELAARQRQREYERAQQLAAERLRQLEQVRDRLSGRQAGLVRRAAALASSAEATGRLDEQRAIATSAAETGSVIGRADSAADMARLDRDMGAIEERIDRLELTISAAVAHRERRAAMAAVESTLSQVPDRQQLDPAGYVNVQALLAAAEKDATDGTAFAARHHKLVTAVTSHLDRSRRRALELESMRRAADDAIEPMRRLVGEADEAGAELDGRDDALALAARLAGRVDAEDTQAAGSLTAELCDLTIRLTAAYDAWHQEQDRTELVLEALVAALPVAGLEVVAGSFVSVGSGARMTARQSDGAQIQIAVIPDERGRSRIEYHGEGRDFAVEQTAEGQVAVCDLTEELLAKLHDELEEHDVRTGELLWDGKPSRPDLRREKRVQARAWESKRA